MSLNRGKEANGYWIKENMKLGQILSNADKMFTSHLVQRMGWSPQTMWNKEELGYHVSSRALEQ